MEVKLTCTQINRQPKGRWLQASWNDFSNPDPVLNKIQLWSVENNCGRRMSFDLWQFRTRADVTAFLLKWGNT